jgi:hypothetical protein
MTFMLLFLGMAAQPDADDATTRDYNEKWGRWMADLAQRRVLESGAPLEPTGSVVKKDGVSALELDTVDIGGYLWVGGEGGEDATPPPRQAPHIELGGTTIVRPCIERPG